MYHSRPSAERLRTLFDHGGVEGLEIYLRLFNLTVGCKDAEYFSKFDFSGKYPQYHAHGYYIDDELDHLKYGVVAWDSAASALRSRFEWNLYLIGLSVGRFDVVRPSANPPVEWGLPTEDAKLAHLENQLRAGAAKI